MYFFVRGHGGRSLHFVLRSGRGLGKGRELIIHARGFGEAYFLRDHGGQPAPNGGGRVGQSVGDDRSARSAGHDAHHLVPSFAHGRAIAPAAGFVGTAGRERAEDLHEHIARQGIGHADVHRAAEQVVAAQQGTAVAPHALPEVQGVALFRHAVQGTQHLRGCVKVEHSHRGAGYAQRLGYSHAQYRVAQHSLLPVGRAHARAGCHEQGLARARRQHAPHGGHAEGEGVVQSHRSVDVPLGQRVFHAGSQFRAFTARFDPVHALRQDARGLGADADHRKGRVRAHGGACGGEEFRIGMFPAGGHEPYATRLLAAARAGHQIFKSFAEDGALAFLHSHSAS